MLQQTDVGVQYGEWSRRRLGPQELYTDESLQIPWLGSLGLLVPKSSLCARRASEGGGGMFRAVGDVRGSGRG